MQRDGFDEWVSVAGPRLLRPAYLLTADWGLAQDLVQHACAACWPRFASLADPDAYARTVMARTASSWWRRSWRGEAPHADVPEAPAPDAWHEVDSRQVLHQALRALPPRQRAVLVLRFYEDMSEAEAARTLGWPVGTVKSTTARALDALRLAGLDELKVQK